MYISDDDRTFQEILDEELRTAKARFPHYYVYAQKEGDNTFIMVTYKSQVCYNSREGVREAISKAYNAVYRPPRDGEI